MSNQEAITPLRNLGDSLDSYCELTEEGKTAFRMAIEALSCSEFPNSSDTINRQDAIDVAVQSIMDWDGMFIQEANCRIRDAINELPSVQPYTAEEIQKMQELESAQVERAYELGRESVQPTGTWLIHKWGDDAQCSNCGKIFKDVYDMDNHDQYCRHCGAHMKGVRAI